MPEHALEERLALPPGGLDRLNTIGGGPEPAQRADFAQVLPVREVPGKHPVGGWGAPHEPRAANPPQLTNNLRGTGDAVIGLPDALLDFRRELLPLLRPLD